MGLKKLLKERSNKSVQDEDGKHKNPERPEESLQEIEGRYRKLLSHTQAIQYTHDLQGQFLSVDQETTELLGYDRNSLLNMNVSALLASEVRHQFETYLDEIKRQGLAKGLMVVQTASGEKRILKYYNTLRTEGVPIPFVQGIAYDVTEQKQTRKALKEISEQLSIILKSLPIVCYIGKAEEDYGATYITHNVKAITGFEQTDFTSKPSFWANRVHPEDAPKIFADLPQIFEKGYHEHQYRWQVADGSYKWFYDYTRLMKSSDGKNYIIGMMQDITERKRAEEALLHAAQEWRTTFDGINDFVSLLDLDGKILRCNKAMKDFVGKPFNEIINHSCWEIILGTTTPIEDCPFLRMKETLHRETTILSVNNLWFNVSIDPIFDQAGRLIGAVNIISDITKRKQAEEALRLFERAIETLQLGLTITDSHGKIVYINLAEAKMHGYQVEELIGKDVRILAPREIWNPMTVEQLLKMDSWKRETINIRKDGSTFPVHLLSVVVPNVPGDALGVITTCEDISERKSAEVALRRSEEKYRTILENIEDGYYEVDIAGNFTFFNDSICRIWGYPKEELMGMNDRQYTDRENAKKLFQAFNKVYRTGEPTKEVGWKIIRKDGTRRYIEASVSLLKDSSGKPIGFRGIIRDVTEHVQADEAVTKLSQENAIMAEIGRIISSTLNIDEVYERFSEQVRKLIPFDRISVSLINPDRTSITVAYAFGIKVGDLPEGAVLPLDDPFTKNILNKRQGVLILPEDESELAKNYPNLVKHFRIGIRSIMTVPLISKDQVIGLLHFQSRKPNSYTESDLKLAERVGNQIAGAIANGQLYAERKRAEEALKKSEEEAKRLSQENAVMAEIGRIISSTLNIDEVYERFSEEVRKLISFDRIMINIVNLKNNTTSFAYITGIDVQGRRVGDIVPLEGTATGECVRMRSSFLFQTESMDEVVKRFPGLLPTFKAGLRSMIFFPLISEDQVIGALSLRSTKPNAYTETDLRLVERVGNQIAGAVSNSQLFIERKRAEEAATRLAQENAVMAEIGRIISSTLNIEEVYERFAEEVRKLIPFDRIVINVIDIEKATVINVYMAGIGIADRKVEEVYPLKGSGNAEMVRTKSSLLIQTEDFNEYKDRFPMLLSTFEAGFRSIMNIPFFSKGRIIGGLLLRSLKPYAYTDEDVRLAERVGDQIAGAIANAQLFIERKRAEEAAARLAQENAVVAEIGRITSSTLNIEEVYERFAQELRKLIFIDRVSLCTINPDGCSATITYTWGPEVKNRNQRDVFPLKGTLVEMVLTRRSGILVHAGDEETFVQTYPTLLNTFRAGFRSFMSVPLISKDQVIGVLILHASKENAYTDQDLTLAEKVGNQIAGAVANSQLFIEGKRAEEAVTKLSQENAVMAEIGRIISSTLNIEKVYEHFSEEVHKLIYFDRIEIVMTNPEDNTISIAYVTGLDVSDRKAGDTIPMSGTVVQEVFRTRSSQLIQPANTEEVASRFPLLQSSFQAGLRSMIFVPLVSEDQVIGVLSLKTTNPDVYTERDLRLTERVGNQIAGAIANAQLFAERKRAEEALRRSEGKFQKLFDEAPVGYQEIDSEGRIIRINRTELDMLGYTAEEMLGKYIWEFITDEESRQKVKGKLAGAIPTGRAFERLFQRKDGITFPAIMEDRVLRDSEGKIAGIRATIQDVTERKRSEEEKSLLQEQLRQSQKMEAIGKLAGGVAHDFNNLLTVIHGYGELLLSSLNQENRLKQDVQEILNASERASSLTRQLLAFSRKQVLQPKVLDLNAHVLNMDKMLRRMIGEDVGLVTLLTKDLGRIKADPGQIEQAILNLAINAKDAMLNGGKLTIETANVKLDENYARSRVGVSPGDYVMLSVSDTGVGIAPETKERIFEPFFTTKEKGKGTGLGLSTVYGIVQQSGGNIWVYSEPGLGTTFKIYLPRIEEGTESVRPAAVSTKPLQGSETVLLVEDEEMVRKLACTVLEKNGYTVLEASNGDEALDVVQGRNGNPIHLVVTDVVMPGMSGRQLADRLVSLRPEIKILYMSGYTDDAIVHHGVLDPGIAYIQKPFTPDALASKVREILDGN